MQFRKECVEQFKTIFETTKPKILEFGCMDVQLFELDDDPTTLFTISHWDSQSDLDNYRNSPVFSDVWKETKSLFLNKASAWSLVPSNRIIN
jgi:quinol monooxygenase YgiN